MIAVLASVKETRSGKEFLEEGIEQGVGRGIENGAAALIQKMAGKEKIISEIADLTDLSEK